MTPKEKAIQRVNAYHKAPFNCKGCNVAFCDTPCTMLSWEDAKQCALIEANEIIKSNPTKSHTEVVSGMCYKFSMLPHVYFWQEVRKEIEKL